MSEKFPSLEEQPEEISKNELHDVLGKKDEIYSNFEIVETEVTSEISEQPESNENLRFINDTYKNFEKTFNLNKGELENIENFKDLTDGQKELVLENLKQISLGDIKKEAIEKYRNEKDKAGFLGKIGRGVFKRFFVAEAEKETAQDFLEGGIEKHGEVISEISKNIKESGLDGHWEINGFSVDYAGNPNNFKNLIGAEKKEVAEFNKIAGKMANMKTEWVYGKENKEFSKIKTEYESAKNNLLKLESIETGSDGEAAMAVAEIDRRVYMNQWINASPDAAKELEQISSQWTWMRALKNVAIERGSYTAMGYAGRTFAVGVLSWAAAPLVAAGMGGWIARKRAIENLKEEAKAATGGGEKKMKRKGDIDMLNIVDAKILAKNIERLSVQIDTAPEEEKDKLLQLMNSRLLYTRMKMNKGLVNFGEGKEKLQSQYALLEKFTKADVEYNLNQPEVKTALDARLEQFTAYKKGKVNDYVKKEMIKGAAMGAGFALLGSAIRELFHYVGGAPKKIEIGKVLPKIDIPQNANGTLDAVPPSKAELPEDIQKKMREVITSRPGIASVAVDTTIGINTAKNAIEDFSSGEVAIMKGGSAWEAARGLKLADKDFWAAWGNPESTVQTSRGLVHISEAGLTHEGNVLKYIPGEGGKNAHFELIEGKGGKIGSDGELFEYKANKEFIDEAFREEDSDTIPEEIPIEENYFKDRKSFMDDTKKLNSNINNFLKEFKNFSTEEQESYLDKIDGNRQRYSNFLSESLSDPDSTISKKSPAEIGKIWEELDEWGRNIGKLRDAHFDALQATKNIPTEEVPAKIENFIPQEVKLNKDGINIIANFKYDESNNPIGIEYKSVMSGTTGYESLKENWQGILSEKSGPKIGENMSSISREGRDLLAKLKLLDSMENNTALKKESLFLNKAIKKILKAMEAKYGDVIDRSKLPEKFRE